MTLDSKRLPRLRATAMAIALAASCGQALAFEFDSGDPDLKIRWDNTFKYSTLYRLHDPDAGQLASFAAGGGAGDGDFNFKKGFVSQRIDWLTEFDAVKDGDKGLRVSATGWYDPVYQRHNDNPGTPGSSHNIPTPANEFSDDTKHDAGRDLRLMDAFVFFKGHLADMPASVRLGQHTVIYGETLMSGSNGIAAAQGPVDIVKAATVPGAQVKEFLLPTPQASFTLQPSTKVSLGAYYQFRWEKSAFFPAGSFLSPNDITGRGGESMLNTLQVPVTADMKPRNGGQWGAQMRYKPEGTDVELGFYAANYHDKTASAVYSNVGVNGQLTSFGLTPPASIAPASYTRVFAQDIRTYGVSASTLLGDDNVSVEASVRRNVPLTGGLCSPTDAAHPLGCGYVVNTTTLLGGPAYDNKDNPLYAVGNTTHMTLVDIHVFQPNALLRDGGSLAVQYDWHTVNSVTKNQNQIDPLTTKSASTITAAFSADWFQAFDGVDLSFPIVWTRNVSGRSRVYVGWVENGGSIDVGVTAKYLTKWKAGFNYHHFTGKHGTDIGVASFDQTAWDRDYVSFNLSTSF